MRTSDQSNAPDSRQDPAAYLTWLAQRKMHRNRRDPRIGLERLLASRQYPQKGLRAIHVAGSKGKGTTALMLESMLVADGWRVGTFSSPHLQYWHERIRINGQAVTDAQLGRVLACLQPTVETLRATRETAVDFFEVLLVAALCLFRDAALDAIIIEAGVGARFDATMVVEPVVSAIVSIEYEHTDLLGNTLTEIATDKAAVARAGMPLIVGPLAPEALAVIEARSAALGAPLLMSRARLDAAACQACVNVGHVRIDDLPLPAPSLTQAHCAAVAVGCLHALCANTAVQANIAAVARQGLARLHLPGRQEMISQAPRVILDTAHTKASLAALESVVAQYEAADSDLYMLLSSSGGRDLAHLATALLARAVTIVLTRADPQRSDDPAAMRATIMQVAPHAQVKVVASPSRALRLLHAQIRPQDMLCITGSTYLVGQARAWYQAAADDDTSAVPET